MQLANKLPARFFATIVFTNSNPEKGRYKNTCNPLPLSESIATAQCKRASASPQSSTGTDESSGLSFQRHLKNIACCKPRLCLKSFNTTKSFHQYSSTLQIMRETFTYAHICPHVRFCFMCQHVSNIFECIVAGHCHSHHFRPGAASWELWDAKPSAQQDVDDKTSRAPGTLKSTAWDL